MNLFIIIIIVVVVIVVAIVAVIVAIPHCMLFDAVHRKRKQPRPPELDADDAFELHNP